MLRSRSAGPKDDGYSGAPEKLPFGDSHANEERHLHRGLAGAGAPPGAAGVLRLRRGRLLFAGDAQANRADLERVKLRQRVLVDVAERDTSTTLVGERVPLPLALGPVAMAGLKHGNGEILACRAAQAAGIPFAMSTLSICSIEDVAQAVAKPFWFQLYVMKDRGFVRSLIERAAAAKCSALVLTVDLQVLGQRHCDVKNGLSVPPALKIKNLINMAGKPAWVSASSPASAGPSAISPDMCKAWRACGPSPNGSGASSTRR